MAWVEALLKGKKVFARARDDGALVVEGGRVEVRYKTNDGRAYRAALGNLEKIASAKVFSDSHCAEAQGAAAVKPARAASKRSSGDSGGKPYLAPPTTSSETEWIAYTDGACSGNPGPAGAGFVVIPPGKSPQEGFESLGIGTNNVAEITAILRAIEAIPKNASTVLHTDSKYAIGVLSLGWKAKANQELIAKTRAVLQGRRVRFVYVPGHSGIPMNERADELAREAIRTEKSHLLLPP
ncbi:MAG: ribonuclease HI [Polyangiaceae bacterium]